MIHRRLVLTGKSSRLEAFDELGATPPLNSVECGLSSNGIEKMRPCRIFRAVGPFRTLVASNDKSRNASLRRSLLLIGELLPADGGLQDHPADGVTTATPSMKDASVVTPVFSTTAEASAANVPWPALKRPKAPLFANTRSSLKVWAPACAPTDPWVRSQ